MPQFTFESKSEDATAAFARGLASVLRGGDTVLLRGGLGAGKTTLTRHLARALGVAPGIVSSPTFVIMNNYPIDAARTNSETSPHAGPSELVHIDAYRLTSAEDLESVGWDRVFDDSGTARAGVVAVVEWPEKIEPAFRATPHAEVRLDAGDLDDRTSAKPGASRRITLTVPDSWADRPGVEHLITRPPIECRTTGRWVEPTAKSYPFIDQRAQMADLNKWFTGGYTISRPATQADFEE